MSTGGPRRVRHPCGFAVDLPRGAELLGEHEWGLEASLPAAAPAARFLAAIDARPRVQVRSEVPVDRRTKEGWVAVSLVAQAEALVGARLLDEESTTIAGRPARRTHTQHLAEARLSVTLEQWWVLTSERETVLSVSLASLDVAAQAATVSALSASLDLEAR